MWRRLTILAAAAAISVLGTHSPAVADGGAYPDDEGTGIDLEVDSDPGLDPYIPDQDQADDGYSPDDEGGTSPLPCMGEGGGGGGAGGGCGIAPGPDGPDEEQPPPPVNPVDLGQTLLDHMGLPSPNISISPGPPNPTLVHMWTWYWIPDSQWVTHSESLTLRGTTVTVTIEPVHSTWDSGEGSLTCDGPGEAWSAGAGDSSSCGHRYETDGSMTVSASIGWHATWNCSGVCIADSGDFGVMESASDSAQLEVRQRQSLVTG